MTLTWPDVANSLYNITLATYFLAGGHFLSELFIFKSLGYGAGSMSPVVVASKP
jgi:hypothetical protein